MTVLVITGFVLIGVGIIGCVLPLVPGPPLSYIALVLLSIAKNWEPFSAAFLIIMGAITLIVTVLDYVMPIFIAKKYGASRLAMWASIIGMLAGMLLLPPFGLFIGAFLGAAVGEFFSRSDTRSALRAGPGVFVGTVLGIVYRLSVSGIIASHYVKAVLPIENILMYR